MTTVYYVDKGNLNIIDGGPLPPAAGDATIPRLREQDVEVLAHKKKRPTFFPSKKGKNVVAKSFHQSQDRRSVNKRSLVAKMRLRKKSALTKGNDVKEKASMADATTVCSKRPASRKPPRFPRKWFEGKKIDDKGLIIIVPERKGVLLGPARQATQRERRNLRGGSSPKVSDKTTRRKEVPQEKKQGIGVKKGISSGKIESGLRVQVFDSPVTAQRKVCVTLLDTDKTVQVHGENIEPFLAIILREAVRNNQDIHIENGVADNCDPKAHSTSAPSMNKSVSFVGRRSFTSQDDPESSPFVRDSIEHTLKHGEMYMKKVSSLGNNPVDSERPNYLPCLDRGSKKERLLEEVSSIVNRMKAKEGLFDHEIEKIDSGDVNKAPPKTGFYALPAIFSNINSNTSQDRGKQKMSIGQIISSNMERSHSEETRDKSIGPQASFSGYHNSCNCLAFGFPEVIPQMNPFEACGGGTSSTEKSTVGDILQLVPCTRVEAVVDDHLGISQDDEHEQVSVHQSVAYFSPDSQSASSFEANLPSHDSLLESVRRGHSFLEEVSKQIIPPPPGKEDDGKTSQPSQEVACSNSVQASSRAPQNESIDIIDMHRRSLEAVSTNERVESNNTRTFAWLASLVSEQLAPFQTLTSFDTQHAFSLFGFADETQRNRDALDKFYRDDVVFTQTKPRELLAEEPIAKKQSVSERSVLEDGGKDCMNETQSDKSNEKVNDALEIKATQSLKKRNKKNTVDIGLAANCKEALHNCATPATEINLKETEVSVAGQTAELPPDTISMLPNGAEEKTEAHPSACTDSGGSPPDRIHVIASMMEETNKVPREVVELPCSDKNTETVLTEPTLAEKAQNFTLVEARTSDASQNQTNDTNIESPPCNQSSKVDECYQTEEEAVDDQHKEESNESVSARLSVSFVESVESENCESIEYPSDYSYDEDAEESIAVNVSFAPNFESLRLDKIMSWAQETFSWEAPESGNQKFIMQEALDGSLASFSQRSALSLQIGTAKSDSDSMGTEETGFLQFEGASSPLMEAFVFYLEDTIDTLHDVKLDAKTPPKKAASFA